MHAEQPTWLPPSFAGLIGVARRDITPPVGIYSRNWGAADHDVAEGVHQPLMCTALSIRETPEALPCYLVAIDASWFRDPQSPRDILQTIYDGLGVDADRLMLCLSHTHAGPSISLSERDKPGGEFIEAYVSSLCDAVIDAAREALATECGATMSVGVGRCTLAADRDLPDPLGSGYLCGFHPDGSADDTLMVARVTRDEDGQVMAVAVNYACHPTTLAWQNRLISPDYVGSLRQTVEDRLSGGVCLFLQGASGELAPREQYTGDTGVAERHGRSLGYAVLSTLEAMPEPAHGLRMAGRVESGASLAEWRRHGFAPPTCVEATCIEVALPLKDDLLGEDEIRGRIKACRDRVESERLRRHLNVRLTVGGGSATRRPVWVWRFGDIVWVGQSDEAYSALQRELRNKDTGLSVFVMNVVNGWGGYLCPSDRYGLDLYQVRQSPYASGCLEAMIEACQGHIASMSESGACHEAV